jgi:chromosomal replication initiation ATPase DnaA
MASIDQLAGRVTAVLSTPGHRPVALLGRSGTGKTTLLRRAAARCGSEVVWRTARDLTERMARSIRNDSYESDRQSLAGDRRPMCLEHVEDLRDRPVTRAEVRRLLESRVEQGHPTILTLTRARADREVVEWLASWTELLVVD